MNIGEAAHVHILQNTPCTHALGLLRFGRVRLLLAGLLASRCTGASLSAASPFLRRRRGADLLGRLLGLVGGDDHFAIILGLEFRGREA
jgi:hypothetical protein